MSPTLSQKLTAEAIGTAILVFIGAGSVPLTVFLTGSQPFGSAQLSTISFAFAFAIFAAVYSVGHISGCHINPAVTIALFATRKIDLQTTVSYIGAQLVGAFIGAGLTYVILIGNDLVFAATMSGDVVGETFHALAHIVGVDDRHHRDFAAARQRLHHRFGLRLTDRRPIGSDIG